MGNVFMTYQELVQTIQTLPLAERLSLLEVLAQSLQADIQTENVRTSSLARVRGMLKPDGPAPSDRELKEAYTDHLIEKYA